MTTTFTIALASFLLGAIIAGIFFKTTNRSLLEAKDKANEEALKAIKEHYNDSVKEQQERFDIAMSRMVNENKAATEDLLKARQKEFAETSSTKLTELLESQGLTEGVHYDAQSTLKTDDGNILRPDVILHLDQKREVIIDSKVSLTAFFDVVNAESEEGYSNLCFHLL